MTKRFPGAVVPLGGVGGGAAVLFHPTLPGWGLVLVLLAAFAVTGAYAVLPQQSADRLAWWRDRRRHQERLRARPAATRRHTLRTAVPAVESQHLRDVES